MNQEFDDREYRAMLREVGASLEHEADLEIRRQTFLQALCMLEMFAGQTREKLAELNERTMYREMIAGAVISMLLTHPAIESCISRSVPGERIEQMRTVAGSLAALLDVEPDPIVMEILRPPDIPPPQPNSQKPT